jgi:hypothetical protein
MKAKWAVRLLALGGMTVALGCRTTTTSEVVTSPLIPEAVAGVPPTPGPSIATAKPQPLIDWARPSTGAQLPGTEARPPKMADFPAATVAAQGPVLAPALPPSEPAHLTTALPGLPEPTPAMPAKPVIKPLLVDAPRPAAGPDGFGPAPIIPPPEARTAEKPVVVETRPAPSTLPINAGQKYGHASDYRWVAGVLDRHSKAGFWTLRYADYGTDDDWGGKVRLLDDEKLRDCRDGDVIFLEGELLAPRKVDLPEGSYPPFRITGLRIVEQRP